MSAEKITGKIRVITLDFDACLSRINLNKVDKVIESNRDFLNQLIEGNKGFDKVVIFNGSNRQSAYVDKYSIDSKNTVSCFKIIKIISKRLNAELDPFFKIRLFINLFMYMSVNPQSYIIWDKLRVFFKKFT